MFLNYEVKLQTQLNITKPNINYFQTISLFIFNNNLFFPLKY